MRPDMAKIIVERPRIHSRFKSPNYTRDLQRLPMEEWPTRQAYRRTDRYLNENLNPLQRYLESNVGRPWNDVHSELAAQIDRGNAVQAHIWQHLHQIVTLHVVIVDGQVLPQRDGRYFYGPENIRLYVHPVTGLLCRKERTRRPRHVPPPPLFRRLTPDLFAGQINAVWFEIRTAPLATAPADAIDVVLKTPVTGSAARNAREAALRHYGDDVYAVAKRTMNSREIKVLGLRQMRRALPAMVR